MKKGFSIIGLSLFIVFFGLLATWITIKVLVFWDERGKVVDQTEEVLTIIHLYSDQDNCESIQSILDLCQE